MKKNAFWARSPRVHRTRRPVAWRKNSSVTVLVANTPTRSRGMSTPSDTMRTATIQGCSPSAKCSIRAEAVGSSLTTSVACTPWRRRSSSTMPRACSWSMAITSPPAWGCTARMAWSWAWAWSSTAGQPLTRQREGGAQALPRAGVVEGVVEGVGVLGAVGSDPLHVAVDPGEVDGPDDPAVVQGVAVAVLVVGVGLAEPVVADEGDGGGVGPERGARDRQPAGGLLEGDAHAVAPRPVLAGVVELVEHHERVPGPRPAGPRGCMATCW